MTLDRRLRFVSLAILLVLALALGFRSGRAEDGPAKPPPPVKGVIYEVFHGDMIHRMGWHVREVHVPSRNLAFYDSNGELRVFRPEPHRYGLPGETIELGKLDGTSVRVPVMAIPGLETRLVGTLSLRAADVDRLEAHLKEKLRLRALADRYLAPTAAYEPVVAFATLTPAAGRFVAGRLDEAGILRVGIGSAGGETMGVPVARAAEARRILREALIRALATPPDGGNPDARLDYRILAPEGHVEWSVDRTLVPPAPAYADVLEHLRRFPGSEWVTEDGKERRQPRYGDNGLEQAEDALGDRLPRPWTVKRLMDAYRRSTDPESDSMLRDETARAAATEGINTYWNPVPLPAGGLESMMDHAQAWWDARDR